MIERMNAGNVVEACTSAPIRSEAEIVAMSQTDGDRLHEPSKVGNLSGAPDRTECRGSRRSESRWGWLGWIFALQFCDFQVSNSITAKPQDI